MPLSVLASEQARPREKAMRKIKNLFYYIASQENVVLAYSASDMILEIQQCNLFE